MIMTTWLPELILRNGCFKSGFALVCDEDGLIAKIVPAGELKGEIGEEPIRLAGRALLPGLVNAHSHAFQRVIRGRTEHRTHSDKDSFWTWREMMYSAATRLSPKDIYD